MFWSITPEGKINGLPDEDFARHWATIYKDDITFKADLTPPADEETYSEEVRRRFDAANAPHQKTKEN